MNMEFKRKLPIPKEIKEDTKIIIKACKAPSNDGSDGIELKNDYTIYANQYGRYNKS